MAKPILVIKFPSSYSPQAMSEAVESFNKQSGYREVKNDYHILYVEGSTPDFQFEVQGTSETIKKEPCSSGHEADSQRFMEEEIERTKLKVQANSPYNDGWTKDFYEKELKRYNVGTRSWPAELSKEHQDFMYNWIRNNSGK